MVLITAVVSEGGNRAGGRPRSIDDKPTHHESLPKALEMIVPRREGQIELEPP